MRLPGASSFKAASVLYYFMDTAGGAVGLGRAPRLPHGVYSNNGTTGEVIRSVGDYLGAKNPIAAYNDFGHGDAGPALRPHTSDLEEFYTPTTASVTCASPPSRFDTVITGKAAQLLHPGGTGRALPLHGAGEDDRAGRATHTSARLEASRELLSITRSSNISRWSATSPTRNHYSKDGSCGRSILAPYVLKRLRASWVMPDEGSYLISFMSAQET